MSHSPCDERPAHFVMMIRLVLLDLAEQAVQLEEVGEQQRLSVKSFPAEQMMIVVELCVLNTQPFCLVWNVGACS